MTEIRFNSQALNNYLEQNKIQLSNDDNKLLGSIFDECNTILEEGETKEERRLSGSEIPLFFQKVQEKFSKFAGHLQNFIDNLAGKPQQAPIQQAPKVQPVKCRRTETELEDYNTKLEEAKTILLDNAEKLGLSEEEINYINNIGFESITDGPARFDMGANKVYFNQNDKNPPNVGNFIKIMMHEITHGVLKDTEYTQSTELACEKRGIEIARKLYDSGIIKEDFPIYGDEEMFVKLSDLKDGKSINHYLNHWVNKHYGHLSDGNEKLGYSLIENFNEKYPKAVSSTWLGDSARDLLRKGGDEKSVNKMLEECNAFANNPNNLDCADRARKIDEELNAKHITNKAIVKIHGTQNLKEVFSFGNHVFNVINLDENADIAKPETWGENAIVVDSWAGKVMKPDEAIKFYRDFLGYDAENQPIYFEEGC